MPYNLKPITYKLFSVQGILFITRKWEGRGGMQQWSRDFWSEIQVHYPDRSSLCALHSMWHGPLFCVCALWRGAVAAMRGWHVHLGDCALLPLGVIFHSLGARVSVTAHGLDVIYAPRFYQRLLRYALPSIQKIVCVSAATATELRARGTKAEQVVVIPCGIRVSEVSLGSKVRVGMRYPLLLSVCRLIPRKGIVWFLDEVFPLLQREFPKIQYTIIGSGKQEKLIKKIVHKKNLQEAVFLPGNCSNVERDRFYACSDLLVVPNVARDGDMEGFGIVCIEAAMHGIPVAASRLQGVIDSVLEGKTGEYFASHDAGDAARVITKMLRHPLENVNVQQAALECFSWDILFSRFQHEVFI